MTANDGRRTLEAELARLRAEHEALQTRATRAEEELRAARAIHQALIESLPFDFWARDREGYCFGQNATTRAHWGDLLEKRPEDMPLPKEVVDVWTANNRRALAGETVIGEQDYSVGGETLRVQNVLAPIRMGDAIVGTVGVNIDITARKRADDARARTIEALRESEEKLRMAVQAAQIGIWSWDVRANSATWNDALCAIFGLPAERAPKTLDAYLALIHPDDRQRALARFDRGFKEGSWRDEFRIVRGDGATRWVSATGTVMNADGVQLALGAVFDETDRRERDERLRQAQKLEAVGQLTAGIAHNFNNMLMGVLPNLELAARDAPSAIVPLLTSAEQSARRAADLVRQLMTFAGRAHAAARTVEAMAPIVARSVELCRTTFDQRIAIATSLDAGARARVDAGQIQQALLNVLINARDAVDVPEVGAPLVTVDVAVVRAGAAELEGRGGDWVRMRIADNGVGMDAATAARLYEPFFTTKEIGKGTGLGLATTHAILREHGGFITCATEPRRGTAFAMYLPRETAPAERASTTSATPAMRGTETVLVVDDEPAVRRVVSVILADAGFDPRPVASGEEALALLADARVASEVRAVLLDVSMPGIPSTVLRARLRELAPHARVVYFTGYAFEAPDAEDAVLEKPVTRDRLLAGLRDALDRAPRP